MSTPDLRTARFTLPASTTGVLPTWAFSALIAFGFGLKLLFLHSIGTQDQEVAIEWGRATLEQGLVGAFNGNNFPITFQTFEGLVWVTDRIGMNAYTGMKLLILLADTGAVILLIALLRRLGVVREWALLYWLFPYSLVMGWLGFDHFIMGFVVLLLLWFVARSDRTIGLVPPAFLMGVLFLQRPQTMVFVVMLGLFIAVVAGQRLVAKHRIVDAIWNERTRMPWALLVGSAAFFVFYSVWFYHGGREPTYLVETYLHLGDWSTGLSGNALNVWGMVAEAYRAPGAELYTAIAPLWADRVALLITGAILIAVVVVVALRGPDRPWLVLLSLFGLASIVMPNAYVHAHSNHFWLGAVLGIPIVAALRHRGLIVAFIAFLTLQAWNLFGLYGFGKTGASSFFLDLGWRDWYPGRFIAAAVSTALFVVILVLMVPRLPTLHEADDRQPSA
jgi:hypothetical protein